MKAKLRHYFIERGLWAPILAVVALCIIKACASMMSEITGEIIGSALVWLLLFGVAWPAWLAPFNRTIRDKRESIRQSRN